MKYILAHTVIALAGLVTAAQASDAPQAPARDATGFLPVPALLSESNQPPVAPNAVADANPTNSTPTTTGGVYELDDKYKLMPGDIVSFEIKEDRTNAVILPVAESGELEVPYIGRLNVSGKTCKQLAEQVKALLEKDYYYRATVVIGVNQRTKVLGNVYIFGPVRQPGQIPIPAGEVFTAGKAIVRAGGFMDFANKKEVKVVRKTDTGTKTFKVNMVDVLEKGKADEDIPLEPEDFVIVQQRAFNW